MALPWELLCADDLVVIAETDVVLIKRLNKWKNNVENRGVRVNMNETKVMISRERQKPLQKAARWPCGVCGRGVGSNLIQCTSCHKWVHKKCSGIKGSMYKVMRPFIMVALRNRADHYIFMVWFVLSSSFFFPRLISAAADWMSATLPHMVWP